MATDRPAEEHLAWIAQVQEEPLDPDLPICDPHHHLWPDEGVTGSPYLLADLHRDTSAGHRIEQTVFVECHTQYRQDGPEHLRPVGEVEWVAELAEQSTKSDGATIAGIVGNADLDLGNAVGDVLDAHVEAGGGRFCGVRYITAQDPHPPLSMRDSASMNSSSLRDGVRLLGARGLSFDAMVYHPQLPDLVDLVRTCPETTTVVDHLGGVLGTGPYKDRREEILEEWRASMAALAECPNAYLKLGGIGMPMMGFRWDKRPTPATSAELADAWSEPIRHAIELFGPERCMFESNFPVDRRGAGYVPLWNAFKLITADMSPDDKRWLFHDAAATAYGLTTLG